MAAILSRPQCVNDYLECGEGTEYFQLLGQGNNSMCNTAGLLIPTF